MTRQKDLEYALIFAAVFLLVGGVGGLRKVLAPKRSTAEDSPARIDVDTGIGPGGRVK